MENANSSSYMRICSYDVERTVVSQQLETWEMREKIWRAESDFCSYAPLGREFRSFLCSLWIQKRVCSKIGHLSFSMITLTHWILENTECCPSENLPFLSTFVLNAQNRKPLKITGQFWKSCPLNIYFNYCYFNFCYDYGNDNGKDF